MLVSSIYKTKKGYIIFSVCNKKRYMHFFHNKKTYKENLDTM